MSWLVLGSWEIAGWLRSRGTVGAMRYVRVVFWLVVTVAIGAGAAVAMNRLGWWGLGLLFAGCGAWALGYGWWITRNDTPHPRR